jgi:hypothetical protein
MGVDGESLNAVGRNGHLFSDTVRTSTRSLRSTEGLCLDLLIALKVTSSRCEPRLTPIGLNFKRSLCRTDIELTHSPVELRGTGKFTFS